MANLTSPPYNHIKPYLPDYWVSINANAMQRLPVSPHTPEYREIIKDFPCMPTRLERHQNVNQYGLFLVRQQHLQTLNPGNAYVKVTRYCKLYVGSLDSALAFNLDNRRIGEAITLSVSPPNSIARGQVVLVISCVIAEGEFGTNNLKQTRDSDWYIEYIVHF